MIDAYSFKVMVDATKFGPYTREGLVENIKVPKKIKFHSLKAALADPVACSKYGMLETPDFSVMGRSE